MIPSSRFPFFQLLVLAAISIKMVAGLTLTSSQRSMDMISSFCNTLHRHQITSSNRRRSRQTSQILQMRDASSAYWFQIGDKVIVTSSVLKAGVDLRGRVGTVVEAWEKCDVDPTCCCAEFVDDNFAVRVKFDDPLMTQPQQQQGQQQGQEKQNINSLIKGLGLDEDPSFMHYFNEDELDKVVSIESDERDGKTSETIMEDEGTTATDGATSAVPFDGMSCKAFKLDQLKMGEQAKRIAAYEASKQQDSL